jgi:hypothetical protein
VDIVEACKTVREWDELFASGWTGRNAPCALQDAVVELRRYFETARGDGEPIRELKLAKHLLMTREGVRRVMPFVLSAEASAFCTQKRNRLILVFQVYHLSRSGIT